VPQNKQTNKKHWVLVAHACNPSYSGDRDQEGSWFKAIPGQIVHETRPSPTLPTNLRKVHHKKGLEEWFKW
jgi:hypothetical protein